MFGSKNSKAADEEAKARKIDASKKSFREAIANTRPVAVAGDFKRCEAVTKRLGESLGKAGLPNDFVKEIRQMADDLMRDAFMKAADIAAHAAMQAAMNDNKELRDKKVKEARDALGGAVRMKAPTDFKMNCERALDAALLSGGVQQVGPTKAKPLDTAPKPENRAKPDARYYEKLAELEAG